jgi:hypothetical protein
MTLFSNTLACVILAKSRERAPGDHGRSWPAKKAQPRASGYGGLRRHALGARNWHRLLRGAYVGLVREEAGAIATPANVARHAGFPRHPWAAREPPTAHKRARAWCGAGPPARSMAPGEWLAKLGARPPQTSAPPFPSGNGLILRRATTLLLAQAAQESVYDSARQPEGFGHRHMDMARPGAAVRRAQLVQELPDRLGVTRPASGEALARVPARPVRRWRRLRRA